MPWYSRSFILFIISVSIVGSIKYVYYANPEDETSTEVSRVRYLATPSNQKSKIDSLDEIYIEGDINDVVIKEFKETVTRNHLKHAKVIFNSQGGNLDQAIELGYLIRNLDFSTDVGEYSGTWNESYTAGCFSACTFAYLGGTYRYFHPKSEFGVHQYKSSGESSLYGFEKAESDVQSFSAYLIDYLTEMGIDPAFYELTSSQKHDDIEYIGIEELVALKVVNNGAMAPTWDFDIVNSQTKLIGSQERIGQQGAIQFKCDDKLSVYFISTRRGYNTDQIKKMKFSLYTDGQFSDITSQVDAPANLNTDKTLVVSLTPDENQILKIIGSKSFGLSFVDHNSMENIHQIDIEDGRTKLLNFILMCKSSTF